MDYHGETIRSKDGDSLLLAPKSDRRSDYLFDIPGGLSLDSSNESCQCHPNTRILGRLLNFAPKGSHACNVRAEYFEYKGINGLFKTVLFVAVRDINALEELLFEYGDPNCIDMFM